MFLPALLLRDFGIGGYLAFLLPNCIGAALMGVVLTASSSRKLLQRHRGMMRLFSLVTAGFQAYFIGWMSAACFGQPTGLLVGSLAAALITMLGIRSGMSATAKSTNAYSDGRAYSIAAWFGSLLLVAMAMVTTFAPMQPPIVQAAELAPLAADLVWLAPVCAFGFALCPYLDLTFHHALQQTGPRRQRTFAVGFLVLFTIMVFLTPLYAQWVSDGALSRLRIVIFIFAHILLQTLLTIWLHARQTTMFSPAPASSRAVPPASAPSAGSGAPVLADSSELTNPADETSRGRAWLIALALAVPLCGALGVLAPRIGPWQGLAAGEVGYRVFMGAYALIFPAYVWLCMLTPSRITAATASVQDAWRRRALYIWLLACIAATPAFYLGFIERQTWWLGPGLGILALARLLLSAGFALPAARSARQARTALPK